MGHAHNKTDLYSGQDDVHENPEIYTQAVIEMGKRVHRVTGRYDIPYLAGLDITGMVYLRDRRIDNTFTYLGKTYSIDDFWIVHEVIEFDHMHAHGAQRQRSLVIQWILSGYDDSIFIPQRETWEYQPAHQIALKAERAAVEARGIDWQWYTEWCDQWLYISDPKHENFPVPGKCPKPLDLRPYEDEVDGGDVSLLQMIYDAGGPQSYMLCPVGERVQQI